LQTFPPPRKFPNFNIKLQLFQIFPPQNRKNLHLTAKRLQKTARELQKTARKGTNPPRFVPF
ncbi:MAG: hypothetical protein NC299_07590, partial [Lachnospiraceae bacterium]|nr:hypothetical protein [Ruminococcus sp.]MCM1275216.1 hypothetical protein [Lachnospiraceae bacterium]